MDDMQSQPAAELPKPSLKKLGGALLGLAHSHLELFSIELQEEKARSFRLLILSGLCLVFGLLVMLGLSAAVLIVFWANYRLHAAIGLSLLFAAALLVCVAKVRRLAREGESPFQATREELARNKERLLP